MWRCVSSGKILHIHIRRQTKNYRYLQKPQPTSQVGKNYLDAEVMLPQGDTVSCVSVIRYKRDADGNPVGRANANPILDTCQYKVYFSDGQVTKLNGNVIADLMYAKRVEDGNE